jgi:hypothetical protein
MISLYFLIKELLSDIIQWLKCLILLNIYNYFLKNSKSNKLIRILMKF